jgi:hypothetical protein
MNQYLGKTGSKVSRLTYSGRFKQEDIYLVDLIQETRIDSIFDYAVSSGITTVDMYSTLANYFDSSPLVFACDKYSILYEYSFLNLVLSYRTLEGDVAYYKLLGLTLSRNAGVRRIFSRHFASILARLIPSSLYKYNHCQYFLDPQFIELCNQALIKWSCLDLMDYSVSTSVRYSYTLFRIFNFLSKDLHSVEDIRRFVLNLLSILTDGCFVWIGRTDRTGITHSTIYKVYKKKLIFWRKINHGSELHDIVKKI